MSQRNKSKTSIILLCSVVGFSGRAQYMYNGIYSMFMPIIANQVINVALAIFSNDIQKAESFS